MGIDLNNVLPSSTVDVLKSVMTSSMASVSRTILTPLNPCGAVFVPESIVTVTR